MKRGRPTARMDMHREIVEALSSMNTPMTTSGISRIITKKLNRRVSWNTIEKYVSELVAMERVTPITLPHSKEAGKTGLTVYALKR